MAEQRNGSRKGPDPAAGARGKTTEQLRADIDEGRTRDKVDHPDPATTPLGTDAEAGGAPPSGQAVADERERSLASDRQGPDERQRQGQGLGDAGTPRGGRPWMIWAIVAVVVIAGIAMYYAFA